MSHMKWFEDARFGMFIHWGSYAVKGFEASWPLVWNDISYADYEALADKFDPQNYDPKEWAALAKAAGMRYVVLTTKHHDGLALFDTKLSDYSTVHRAAKRDLIRPYVEALREAGLKVGFYFSLCDWHHPDYPADCLRPEYGRPAHNAAPGAPASIAADPARWDRYIDFMHGQVRELLTNYGKIDLVWFDGQWEHTAEEWRSAELVKMMRELQPEIIINDRLADPSLGDYSTPEQHVPVDALNRPWETCMTINETWAFNPRDRAFKSSNELIATLAEVTSKNGTFLLNVGPTKEGEIPAPFASRLRVIGQWMDKNSESIYGARQGLPAGAYYGPSTASEEAIYLHVVGYPTDGVIRVRGLGKRARRVTVLSSGHELQYDQHAGHLEQGLLRITLPEQCLDPQLTVIKIEIA